MAQFGNDTVNHLVGLGVGTTSCNNGDQPFNWFALPQIDHPVIPQNFYRMSGGADNLERFEQIGQSWLKHAFTALEGTVCGTCNTSGCTTGTHLCPGCSDPYGASLNASQTGIGSRAWVNPFTGAFPSTANNHSGHSHTGTSHRVTVASSDLDPAQNSGATYFAEGQYVTPHEYAWCQSHPGQCNMYNNASYRQFTVAGSGDNYTFSPSGPTFRMLAAINAWQTLGSATVNRIEPDPGNDGIWFMGYKVTNPSIGVWHYEYALYNQNLDRSIQSFSVPIGPGVNISNIGFHAPRQEPGWANDGTQGNTGFSSTPWSVQTSSSITWSTETFAQNQNANAIRFGTLYNFRFDADQPPNPTNATVGYFKTGGPGPVLIQAPGGVRHPPLRRHLPQRQQQLLQLLPPLRSRRQLLPLLLRQQLPRLLLRQRLQRRQRSRPQLQLQLQQQLLLLQPRQRLLLLLRLPQQHLLRGQLLHRGLVHRRVHVPLPCRARSVRHQSEVIANQVAAPQLLEAS